MTSSPYYTLTLPISHILRGFSLEGNSSGTLQFLYITCKFHREHEIPVFIILWEWSAQKVHYAGDQPIAVISFIIHPFRLLLKLRKEKDHIAVAWSRISRGPDQLKRGETINYFAKVFFVWKLHENGKNNSVGWGAEGRLRVQNLSM